ncbi:18613_t:CDS:2 [Rhizophagus irregularis]|nr:18613_t:CDS:2 [Rhizophagus irregularis]
MAFIPATKAYEILLRNGGGDSHGNKVIISDFIELNSMMTCCTWEEDDQRNFITFIPPNVPHKNNDYYCFPCSSFDIVGRYFGADLRNGILTYQTIDNTTTYWIHLGSNYIGAYYEAYQGGYNKDACFMLTGYFNAAEIEELSYDDCKKIRGP